MPVFGSWLPRSPSEAPSAFSKRADGWDPLGGVRPTPTMRLEWEEWDRIVEEMTMRDMVGSGRVPFHTAHEAFGPVWSSWLLQAIIASEQATPCGDGELVAEVWARWITWLFACSEYAGGFYLDDTPHALHPWAKRAAAGGDGSASVR